MEGFELPGPRFGSPLIFLRVSTVFTEDKFLTFSRNQKIKNCWEPGTVTPELTRYEFHDNYIYYQILVLQVNMEHALNVEYFSAHLGNGESTIKISYKLQGLSG